MRLQTITGVFSSSSDITVALTRTEAFLDRSTEQSVSGNPLTGTCAQECVR